jgi:hypothetical protein
VVAKVSKICYSIDSIYGKEKTPMKNYSQEYYAAGEAQTRLGLSKAMFHKKVRQGLIPKTILPGMKQGVYAKRDIEALAMSMSLAFEPSERVVFSHSTPADQVEEHNIGIRCFGRDFSTPLSERIAFQQKSEFSFHSLKVDGQVVGYVSLFRLPDSVLDDLLTGKRIEREITAKEILPFKRLEPFSVYIDVIAVDPKLSRHLRHLYGGIMILRFVDVLLRLLAKDYQINRVYAVVTTRESEKLVRKLGFQRMEGKSLVSRRIPYEYPLDTQALQLQDGSEAAMTNQRPGQLLGIKRFKFGQHAYP